MNDEMRAEFRRQLEELLDRREAWERDWRSKPEDLLISDRSRAIYRDVVAFAAAVCGQGIIARSLTPIHLARDSRSAVLLALRERLGQLCGLLEVKGTIYSTPIGIPGEVDPEIFRFDVERVRSALLALTQGDAPALFESDPREPGKPLSHTELLKLKLRALEWKACLRSKRFRNREPFKMRADKLNELIAEAFGVPSWKTVEGWKRPCKGYLGKMEVFLKIETAKLGNIEGYQGEYSIEALRRDGQLLQEVAHRRVR